VPGPPTHSHWNGSDAKVVDDLHASVDEPRSDSLEFLIRHEKLDLRIFLWPSKSLLLHEETIPDRVAELKSSLLGDGVVKDPIVVDAGSRVVLDGMHRVAALRELNSFWMPVCAVDYLNPSIKVGVWFRVFYGQVSPAQFEATTLPSTIRMERFSLDIMNVMDNPSVAMIFAGGDSFRLTSTTLPFHEVIKEAERCAQALRLTVAFDTEHDAIDKVLNRKADAIMTLPKIDKASIREAGLTGHPLPHKVTRHVIPARPLRVNVPLKMLADETLQLEDANRRFVSNLRSRGTTRRPPGTVIEGRRYEEETFIFN